MLIGMDIGGTKCAVLRAGDDGKITGKIKFPTTTAKETQDAIFRAARELAAGDVPRAVGISCGSPLDSTRGVILSPPNLPGWDEVPITKMAEEALGAPAYLCNDANACALAEWKYGAGRGTRNMIFLTFGTGMGAGLILDGRLYEGTRGMAGECGHTRIEHDGPVGYGKAGSFEGFCSGGGLRQLGVAAAKRALEEGHPAAYCRTEADLPTVSAKTVADAAHAGDPTAIGVYRLCAEKLGRGVSVLCDLFDPERIVIGSIFERAEDLLRPGMEEIIRQEALFGGCPVVPAELGDAIGDYAAVAIAAAHL